MWKANPSWWQPSVPSWHLMVWNSHHAMSSLLTSPLKPGGLTLFPSTKHLETSALIRQNLTVLTICISNEQVNLQWAHIPRECCPGCSSTWVVQCTCVFLSGSQGTDLYWLCVATQGRYILIQNGLRGQLDIDHTPDCMTKASLWHSGVCMGLCCLSLWENLTSLQ